MKRQTKMQIALALLFPVVVAISIYSCNSVAPSAQNETVSQQSLVERGNYIVNMLGGCNDCHSPKISLPDGTMIPDTSKLLSGHPAGKAMPVVDTSAVLNGRWVLTSSDLTAFVGPWGISYTANLTPDTLTGIGAWSLENFIGALRKGR